MQFDLDLEFADGADRGVEADLVDVHLFGSVSERTIFEKLASLDVKVNINKIRLDAPIRTIGEFKVEIKLHQQVAATATIKVVGAA